MEEKEDLFYNSFLFLASDDSFYIARLDVGR